MGSIGTYVLEPFRAPLNASAMRLFAPCEAEWTDPSTREKNGPPTKERAHKAMGKLPLNGEDSHSGSCRQHSPIGQSAKDVSTGDRDDHLAQRGQNVWRQIESCGKWGCQNRYFRRRDCGPEMLFQVQDPLPQVLNLKNQIAEVARSLGRTRID
jgi:hypothetical protein